MAEKNDIRDSAKGFFKGLKAEFRKIMWPDKEQVGKQTLAVVIISLITCAVIRVIDIAAQALVTGAGSIF